MTTASASSAGDLTKSWDAPEEPEHRCRPVTTLNAWLSVEPRWFGDVCPAESSFRKVVTA